MQNNEPTSQCWKCEKLVTAYNHDFKYEINVIHGQDAKNLLGFKQKLPNVEDFDDVQSDNKIEKMLNKKFKGTMMNIGKSNF